MAGPGSSVGCTSVCDIQTGIRLWYSDGPGFDLPFRQNSLSGSHFYGYSLPTPDTCRAGSCQLQAKGCALSTGEPLRFNPVQEKCGFKLTGCLDMTTYSWSCWLGRCRTKQSSFMNSYRTGCSKLLLIAPARAMVLNAATTMGKSLWVFIHTLTKPNSVRPF